MSIGQTWTRATAALGLFRSALVLPCRILSLDLGIEFSEAGIAEFTGGVATADNLVR